MAQMDLWAFVVVFIFGIVLGYTLGKKKAPITLPTIAVPGG